MWGFLHNKITFSSHLFWQNVITYYNEILYSFLFVFVGLSLPMPESNSDKVRQFSCRIEWQQFPYSSSKLIGALLKNSSNFSFFFAGTVEDFPFRIIIEEFLQMETSGDKKRILLPFISKYFLSVSFWDTFFFFDMMCLLFLFG